MARILRVAFIGAGAINFGGAEGPWDHATRLEKMESLDFIAIVDTDLPKAKSVLESRKKGTYGHLYKHCEVYPSYEVLLTSTVKPDVILLGIPPVFRGSLAHGKDIELNIIKAGIHLFVEKPLSVVPQHDMEQYAKELLKYQSQRNTIVSVGYMFRYHAAILKMKEIIKSFGGNVMAFNARYFIPYDHFDHPFWWDIDTSGGPIVEQATHFCDLARFLVGDVDLESVHTSCVKATTPGGVGKLSSVPAGREDNIAIENRVPRVTVATWRFTSGGLGTLMHAVALHGKQLDTYIDILMDGMRLTLHKPFTKECKLLIRDGRTGSDEEVAYNFCDDDPYERELAAFLRAVRSSNDADIASTYADAAETYAFTWAIRGACERE